MSSKCPAQPSASSKFQPLLTTATLPAGEWVLDYCWRHWEVLQAKVGHIEAARMQLMCTWLAHERPAIACHYSAIPYQLLELTGNVTAVARVARAELWRIPLGHFDLDISWRVSTAVRYDLPYIILSPAPIESLTDRETPL